MEGTGTDPLLVNFPTFRLYVPLSYRGIYFQIVGINTNENKPFNIIVIQRKIPSTNPCYFSLFGGLREEKVRTSISCLRKFLWKIAAFQILRKRNLTRFPRVQATIFIN